ncbi:hypothetical protein [Zophobihabitans entericus]|uniref:Lipoprotein n=1 Tax=Zophobihabitans entericus TaxID=1635327 RepID=A0A6G9IDG6_9GAMM|nr:hypothetical protein [Zophobihabitans entericus]QIQ22278.1 hypothetical protein IPMB12_11625 [Zophobihabitans entericus]
MKKYGLWLIALLSLSGCGALNGQTKPDVLEECHYETVSGELFVFNTLPESEQNEGYKAVYVAQSREAGTLPYDGYAGLKGKLTDNVIIRDYPRVSPFLGFGFGRSSYPFGARVGTLVYDDYNDFYLTSAQRETMLRNSRMIFRQAILENCEVVYFQIDYKSNEYVDVSAIEEKNITLLGKNE